MNKLKKSLDTIISSSRALAYIYIFIASIFFISKIGHMDISGEINCIISFPIILLAIYKAFTTRKSVKDMISIFVLFLIPRVVVHIYSLILYIMGQTTYLTRNTQTYYVIIVVFAAIYLIEDNIIENTVSALIASYSIVITYNIINYGIISIPETLKTIFLGVENNYYRLFEVHDYTFSLGYIIILYIFYRNKCDKGNKLKLIIISIFYILGYKRIGIMAVIIVCILLMILEKINSRNIMKFIITLSIGIIVLNYLFIWLIDSSILFDIASKLGVNLMGREYFYKDVMNLCTFNPLYLGIGRNSVSHILATEMSYLKVGGVHSDILKYYVEIGFIMFGLWMAYYLTFIPIYLKKITNLKVVIIYFLLTSYSFLVYYTDNIDTYFICQYVYTIIIVSIVLKEKNKLNKRVRKKNE